MSRLRAAGLRLAAVAVSTAASLLAGELLVRASGMPPAADATRYDTAVTGVAPGPARPPSPWRPSLYTHDATLGYALVPGIWARERGWRGSTLAFEACYSTDVTGLRTTPPPADPDAPLVAIFGDSQAFGQGTNDDETAAARLAAAGIARAISFGHAGHGPHQLLAMLETGRERPFLEGHEVRAGFFVAAADPYRPLGRRKWGRSGPLYRIGVDGRPVRHGSFADSRTLGLFWRIRERSRLVERVDEVAAGGSARRLWVSLVVEAARVFESRYGAPFTVVALTRGLRDRQELVDDLSRARVPLIAFSAEADRCGAPPGATLLADGHLSPYGQLLLAERLAYEIEALGPVRRREAR